MLDLLQGTPGYPRAPGFRGPEGQDIPPVSRRERNIRRLTFKRVSTLHEGGHQVRFCVHPTGTQQSS